MRLFHTTRSAETQTETTVATIGSEESADWSARHDQSLCRTLNSGSPDEQSKSFGVLYDRYESMIRNYVSKQLNYQEDDSLEVIGDTWLVFWRERANFAWRDDTLAENPLQSWLYGIARNRIKSRVRQKEKERQSLTAVPLEQVTQFIEGRMTDGTDESRNTELPIEANQRLNLLLKELKPTEQQIVALRYYRGMTYTQISQQLGKSSAAVRTAHTRLIQKLRQLAESQSKEQ